MKIKTIIVITVFYALLVECNKVKFPTTVFYTAYTKSDSISYSIKRIDSKNYLKEYYPSEMGYQNDTIQYYYRNSNIYYNGLEFRSNSRVKYNVFDSVNQYNLEIIPLKSNIDIEINGMIFNSCQEFIVKYSSLGVKDGNDIKYLINFKNMLILQIIYLDENGIPHRNLEIISNYES